MVRADQSSCTMTILALNSEKGDTGEDFRNVKYPGMYNNLHGIEAGGASMPVKRKS